MWGGDDSRGLECKCRDGFIEDEMVTSTTVRIDGDNNCKMLLVRVRVKDKSDSNSDSDSDGDLIYDKSFW